MVDYSGAEVETTDVTKPSDDGENPVSVGGFHMAELADGLNAVKTSTTNSADDTNASNYSLKSLKS